MVATSKEGNRSVIERHTPNRKADSCDQECPQKANKKTISCRNQGFERGGERLVSTTIRGRRDEPAKPSGEGGTSSIFLIMQGGGGEVRGG